MADIVAHRCRTPSGPWSWVEGEPSIGTLRLAEMPGCTLELAYSEAALAATTARCEGVESTERRALIWLAGGDSGSSSEAICHHMIGLESDGSRPYDPGDLGRCLRLLELFPEWKPRIGEMARYSPQWAALVANWDNLTALMAEEVGIDWSKGNRAERTYKAIQDALAGKGAGGG